MKNSYVVVVVVEMPVVNHRPYIIVIMTKEQIIIENFYEKQFDGRLRVMSINAIIRNIKHYN